MSHQGQAVLSTFVSYGNSLLLDTYMYNIQCTTYLGYECTTFLEYMSGDVESLQRNTDVLQNFQSTDGKYCLIHSTLSQYVTSLSENYGI